MFNIDLSLVYLSQIIAAFAAALFIAPLVDSFLRWREIDEDFTPHASVFGGVIIVWVGRFLI